MSLQKDSGYSSMTSSDYGSIAAPPEAISPAAVRQGPLLVDAADRGSVHVMPRSRPAFGILLLVASAPLVSALVRDDYFAQGALFNSALVLTVALLAVPVYLGLRNPLSTLRADHLLMFGLV